MKNRKISLIIKLLSGLVALMAVVIAVFAISGYYKADLPNSFLPDYESGSGGGFVNGSGTITIENQWYTLCVDSAGNMTVSTKDNKTILSRMAYFANYEGHNETLVLDDILVNKMADSVVVLSGKVKDLSVVTIIITASLRDPNLKFAVKTQYMDSVVVLREAIIADYDIPVKEVYLKNRKAERNPEYMEYWLEKQGISLGNGSRSSIIYLSFASDFRPLA